MSKPSKTISELEAEKAQIEQELSQLQHKKQRYENRIGYYENGDRKKRTHRLCSIGGTVEKLSPEFKELSKTELFELLEYIFTLPEVQRAVRHSFFNHQAKIKQEQEGNYHGSIPSECHTD